MNRSYVNSSTGTDRSRREVDYAEGWWRWPLVPLAAIAASLVAIMGITFCGWYTIKMFGGIHEDGWIYRYILPVVGSGWAGFAWCYSSAYVAPRGKVITSAVMATVVSTIVLALAGAVFAFPQSFSTHPIEMALNAVATIVGSVIATVGVAQQQQQAAEAK